MSEPSKPVCPSCGANEPLPIVYGLPSPELMDLATTSKTVVLGGCVIDEHVPDWECRVCKRRFSNRADSP